jgi:hypothetical protein
VRVIELRKLSFLSDSSRTRLASTYQNPESQYKQKTKLESSHCATGMVVCSLRRRKDRATARSEGKKFTPEKMARLQRTEERSKATDPGRARTEPGSGERGNKLPHRHETGARSPVTRADEVRGKSQRKGIRNGSQTNSGGKPTM